MYDLLGEHSKALTDFQSISSRYKNSLVAGNETLPYFIGREMLFMLDLQTGQSREKVLVDMRAAFEQSLAINSSYIPAQLGLRPLRKSAEPVITEGDGTTPMFATATRTINAAITQFNSALKIAKDNWHRNPLPVTKTQIALQTRTGSMAWGNSSHSARTIANRIQPGKTTIGTCIGRRGYGQTTHSRNTRLDVGRYAVL